MNIANSINDTYKSRVLRGKVMDIPNCKNCYHYGVCHYVDSTLPVCGVYVERDKVVAALQAEEERNKCCHFCNNRICPNCLWHIEGLRDGHCEDCVEFSQWEFNGDKFCSHCGRKLIT